MSNAMSLKAKIRNIAKKKNIPAQVILQNYMFERLLVRLSVSDYREKFVLKGGMLVAAIYLYRTDHQGQARNEHDEGAATSIRPYRV